MYVQSWISCRSHQLSITDLTLIKVFQRHARLDSTTGGLLIIRFRRALRPPPDLRLYRGVLIAPCEGSQPENEEHRVMGIRWALIAPTGVATPELAQGVFGTVSPS